MSKINVIIIDDEPKSIQTLTLLLAHYHQEVVVLDTAGSVASGLAAIEAHKDQIDLLFVDIQMPDGDGFTLLQRLPDIRFRIIFTTAYDQYAIRAIRFSALDYLLKPINNVELGAALDKYLELRKTEQRPAAIDHFRQALQQKTVFDKLAVPTLNEILFLRIAQILYMKSNNNYTTIFFENGQQVLSSRNIGHYEELLEEHQFFRVHNSFLVNLKKVERFIKSKNGMLEIEGGTTILVSGRRKEALFEKLSLH